MRILGVDPGLQRTGWGVLAVEGRCMRYQSHGVIVTQTQDSDEVRLAQLYRALTDVVDQWSPDVVAIEETFVNTNARSSMAVDMSPQRPKVSLMRLNIWCLRVQKLERHNVLQPISKM